MVLTNLLSKAM